MRDETIITGFLDGHKSLRERWNNDELSFEEYVDGMYDLSLDTLVVLRNIKDARVISENMKSILGGEYAF